MAEENGAIPAPESPETKQEPEKPALQNQEEDIKDSHGQVGINKERHDKEVAELKKTIKELQEKLDEQAKTAAGREEMGKEIAELKQKLADNEVKHELELAQCRNVKAAKALLDDYEGDVAKLKAAEPWLFVDKTPQGATGAKPAAPPQPDIMDELRAAAGLKKKG